MSFFGKLFGAGDEITSLDSKESVVAVLYAIIAADGHITDEEAQDFIKTLSRAKFMNSVTGNQWRDMINKISRITKTSGVEGLINLACQNIPEDIKPGVFAYACDLVFSDGYCDPEEQKVLDQIKANLNIDDALAYKVAEVVVIKNKL